MKSHGAYHKSNTLFLFALVAIIMALLFTIVAVIMIISGKASSDVVLPWLFAFYIFILILLVIIGVSPYALVPPSTDRSDGEEFGPRKEEDKKADQLNDVDRPNEGP